MNKKHCRLCLTSPVVGYSLLENGIANMLESLTKIKVISNDKYSTISCFKCLLNVKLAFKIQQNILRADEKLRNLVRNIEIKMELPNNDNSLEDIESGIDIKTEIIDCVENGLTVCDSVCAICGIIVKGDLYTEHVQEHFNLEQGCKSCGKTFSSITEYKNHKNCDMKTNFTCLACGAEFRYESLYNIHIETHIPTKKKDKIKSTDTVKESKVIQAIQNSFLKSVTSETESKQGPEYRCNICGKTFGTKRQYKSHSHDKEPCPICHAQITKSNIRKHVLNHSSGPQICELCGATLRSLESLRGHMAHTHSSTIYKCEECGKEFHKRYTFVLHCKKHSGKKEHVCETCGKAFLTFFYLNKHIKIAHLKLRPYVCQYCKKHFSTRNAMRTHIRQHTNETPYKCEVCGEGFRQNISLRSHRKSKHNIIEPKTCACKVCGKKFGSEHAIISHMRLH